MIKLSLFMLDPVKAHEKYRKEVDELKGEIKKKEASHKELKLQYNLLKKKIKSQRENITVLNNKLRDERTLNEVWEN